MPRGRGHDDEGTTWGAARVLDVLEFLARRASPAPASIIASSCDIPRSSTYGLLNLLKSRRFVAYRANERAWTLGSAAFELSADAPLFAHGLAVLRAFATASRGLTPHQIASGAGMSRAAVSRILPYLVESDLLRAEPDGTYALGLELVGLASRVGWVDRLRLVARPHLARLRNATQETANLIVLDGDHAIYVDQVESPYALRHSGVGGAPHPAVGHGRRRRLRGAQHVARRQGCRGGGRHSHRLRHRHDRLRRGDRHHGAELAHRGVRRRARAAHGRSRGPRDLTAPAHIGPDARGAGGRRSAGPFLLSTNARADVYSSRLTSWTAPPASGAYPAAPISSA